MAALIGKDGIHKLIGQVCDLCGQGCDGEKEELNALGCTYPACNEEASVYHQDCIEKYLRSIRLEKNRKTGYHCPRGSGKHSKSAASPCPGRVTKSHPIHIRNDQAKKRQKAKPAEPAPAPQKPFKGKGKAAAAEVQAQNKGKFADIMTDPKLKEKPAKGNAKPKAAEGQVRHLAGPSVTVNLPEPASKPKPVVKLQEAPKITAPLDKNQMKDAVYRAKLELGLQASPPAKMSKTAAAAHVTSEPQVSGLRKDEESAKAARPSRAAAAQPAVTAWQRSGSIASIVHSSSSAQAASDAGSLRSETPCSLAPQECTPTRQQLHHDKSVVNSTAAGPKDEQVQAAASPMTPNAIKAFQPDQLSDSQSDFDTPMASATGPYSPAGYSTEDFHRTSSDSQSLCSDEVSDALFPMDPSSESFTEKLGAPSLQELAHSAELETDHKAVLQGTDCRSGAQLPSSHCLQGGSKTLPMYSSHSSADSGFGKQASAAATEQQFLQAIGTQKALACVIQYQILGYSHLQGIAAVNKWGADMHAALGWLLENTGGSQEPVLDDTPTVDISDELKYLGGCQRAFTLPQDVLQQIVIHAKGSLPLSLSTMETCFLQASSLQHSMDVYTGGKESSAALPQISLNSITPLSGQHPLTGDTVSHIQGWPL